MAAKAARRLNQLLAAVLALALCTGCSTWRHPNASTDTGLAAQIEGKTVRLVLVDGEEVLLENARIEGDSLIGTLGSKAASEAVKSPTEAFESMAGPEVVIPLDNIRSLEVREFDVAKTVFRTTGVIVTVGLLVYLLYREFDKSFKD